MAGHTRGLITLGVLRACSARQTPQPGEPHRIRPPAASFPWERPHRKDNTSGHRHDSWSTRPGRMDSSGRSGLAPVTRVGCNPGGRARSETGFRFWRSRPHRPTPAGRAGPPRSGDRQRAVDTSAIHLPSRLVVSSVRHWW